MGGGLRAPFQAPLQEHWANRTVGFGLGPWCRGGPPALAPTDAIPYIHIRRF